jgi:hypothetical protein
MGYARAEQKRNLALLAFFNLSELSIKKTKKNK